MQLPSSLIQHTRGYRPDGLSELCLREARPSSVGVSHQHTESFDGVDGVIAISSRTMLGMASADVMYQNRYSYAADKRHIIMLYIILSVAIMCPVRREHN